MERKLIFLDIDGTILIPGEGIRQTVKDGLCQARKRGHQVFICTGRSWCSLPEELEDMALDGVIASAGSDIWIHGRNVYRSSLSTELIMKACQILEEMNAVYVLEGFQWIYVSETGRKILTEGKAVLGDNPEIMRWKQFFRTLKNVRDIHDWEPGQIPKITFMFWDRGNVERLYQELGADFYFAFFQQETGDFVNGEMISRSANKGTAIQYTAELLQADIRNTIAFGDSMNDYQMIEQAGCGVVMGDGDEELKEIADRICEPVREDGVICELRRMGVIA